MQENKHKSGASIVSATQSVPTNAFSIPLPSKGVLYEGKLPGGNIRLRPLSTEEESILYSPVGDGITKINTIIDHCVLSKEIPSDELLMIDRFAILLALRTNSLGPKYHVPVRCRYCSAQFKSVIDIVADFDCKYMEEGLTEPFEVKLPKCGKTVQYRLLRGKDEIRVAQHAKKVRMKSVGDPSDPSYTYRMGLQIVGIDGKEAKIDEAEAFARAMNLGDSTAFRLAVEKVEGGIDTSILIDCTACGATNELDMPFDVEFFRPSTLSA